MSYIFHVDPRAVADAGDEESIQLRFRVEMHKLAPTVRLVATPNGGKRSSWEAAKAKREGLVKGEPDLTAHWSNGIDATAIPGVAKMEFKSREGVLKPEQIDALNWYARHGFPCGVFRSVSTAIAFLRTQQAPFA